MPQMRTSIKIRAGYRSATLDDGARRCGNCSRSAPGFKGYENHAKPITSCRLLGVAVNPAYICREYKQEEN